MAWQNERTVPDTIQAIIGNVQEIVRSEVRLAQAEMKEKSIAAAKAGGILAAGLLLGVWALGFLLTAIAFALGIAIPAWGAALCVAALAGVVAAILAGVGIHQLRSAKPQRTIQSIKENVSWAKQQPK